MEVFLLVVVGWVFSVCLHEYGHAAVALRGGDYTVRDKGYLSMNPIHYAHPVYSFVMPLIFMFMGGIGLPGGAVYIEDRLLRSKGWRTATSLAGPAMNLILVLLLCIPFWLGIVDDNFGPALTLLLQLEISAILFNLLPVPPLDGFQALAPWLPADIRERGMANANMFFWVLFLVMWNVPAASHSFWSAVYSVMDFLRLDPSLADEGWRQFRFWH